MLLITNARAHATRALALIGIALAGCVSVAWAQEKGCTSEERREALRALQSQVLHVAPQQLDSLQAAVQPGGPLAGWGMGHGHVVMAHTGAVPVGNRRTKDPWPQLLQYAPSPSSSSAAWLDWDGPDGPYRVTARYLAGCDGAHSKVRDTAGIGSPAPPIPRSTGWPRSPCPIR